MCWQGPAVVIRLCAHKGASFSCPDGGGGGARTVDGGSLPRAFLRNLKNQLQRQMWTSLQNYLLGEYLKAWRHRLDSVQFCVERNQAFTQRDKGQSYRRKPGKLLFFPNRLGSLAPEEVETT